MQSSRKRPGLVKLAALGTLMAAVAALTACGGGGSDQAAAPPASPPPAAPPEPPSITIADASAACPALSAVTVPAASIGLATGGAVVTSATLQAENTAAGSPEYCRILGSVRALNPADPPINFQLNLPTKWNVKSLQFGGGGFNGSVVSATGRTTSTPSTVATPLAQGYATFGGDSGHQGGGGTFGANDQARVNYIGEAIKRTHDATAFIINAYYKSDARRTYFSGGSKGGQEALIAAQRYTADYDGVVSYYPANLAILPWYRAWSAAYEVPGGGINRDKQTLIESRVMSVCDGLDGAVDGLVGNTAACRATFAINDLRCPSGTDEGNTCLSDQQVSTLMVADTPMHFAFPMAFGYTKYGPFPVFQGGELGSVYDATGTNGTATSFYGFNDPFIRYFFQRDAASSSLNWDYRRWQSVIQEISAAWDAKDPNLDPLRAKGGKILLLQGTIDMLVPESATSDYYKNVKARYGTETDKFFRYYVAPGFGHGGGKFSVTWDSLDALDRWVETGVAPQNPVATDNATATRGRTRPLCEYPLFPKYSGTGDVNLAASFTCSAS